MRRPPILTAAEAAALIPDGATVAISSSSAIGCPDDVLAAIGERYEQTASPKQITSIHAINTGDMSAGIAGIDHIAKPGLLARIIGGSYPAGPSKMPKPAARALLEQLQTLSGVALETTIDAQDGTRFKEAMLFTHRGLSGPGVLQISSYWQPGEFVTVNLLPDCDLDDFLNEQRSAHPNQSLKNTLAMQLPKRLVECLQQLGQIPDVTLKQLNVRDQQTLVETLTAWRVQPNGTEGYRTAEVTLGGVDTNELSSRTMEARKAPGLYFIGEVMDVTGWLGGYNFQWAWSSAWACAQALVEG